MREVRTQWQFAFLRIAMGWGRARLLEGATSWFSSFFLISPPGPPRSQASPIQMIENLVSPPNERGSLVQNRGICLDLKMVSNYCPMQGNAFISTWRRNSLKSVRLGIFDNDLYINSLSIAFCTDILKVMMMLRNYVLFRKYLKRDNTQKQDFIVANR